MQWITLSNTNVWDAKAYQLINAVSTTVLASGQSDPVPQLISSIIEELRGAIGYSGKYQVSATASSIPPNLKDMAVQKVVRLCKRRLEQQLTLDERDEESVYQRRLGLIRAGDWPIDQPDDPLAISPSTPQGRVSDAGTGICRQFTTRDLSNL